MTLFDGQPLDEREPGELWPGEVYGESPGHRGWHERVRSNP